MVSGAAGGIGTALCRALRRAGATVAGLDVEPATEADLVFDCRVEDAGAVSDAVKRASAELGPLGFAVAAAGVTSAHPVVELDPGEWSRVVAVSLDGTANLLRAILPHLVTARSGSVVAFSSGYATKGQAGGAHYAAAKGGVEALVKSAALEVAAHGVRVNAVAPGPIETSMLDDVAPSPQDRAARRRAVPMGRLGRPDDVVGPVLFLLGPASAYVTGQVLHVNGGLLMP